MDTRIGNGKLKIEHGLKKAKIAFIKEQLSGLQS